jgi:hypothetical protein
VRNPRDMAAFGQPNQPRRFGEAGAEQSIVWRPAGLRGLPVAAALATGSTSAIVLAPCKWIRLNQLIVQLLWKVRDFTLNHGADQRLYGRRSMPTGKCRCSCRPDLHSSARVGKPGRDARSVRSLPGRI